MPMQQGETQCGSDRPGDRERERLFPDDSDLAGRWRIFEGITDAFVTLDREWRC